LKTILSQSQLNITVKRLAHQIVENNLSKENLAIIGLQPRGIYFADRLVEAIRHDFPTLIFDYGTMDITFYRDDIRKELHHANETHISFSMEEKKVVLVDDVLYTGRTIRSAFDALLAYGRPAKVELCVLIDRRFSRQFPIQGDYIGKSIDSIVSQKVQVSWQANEGTDEVILFD